MFSLTGCGLKGAEIAVKELRSDPVLHRLDQRMLQAIDIVAANNDEMAIGAACACRARSRWMPPPGRLIHSLFLLQHGAESALVEELSTRLGL
ncbi:hypothetical protein, partial [Klebsiella pneumoniae]|uniref:hypothetical protein n=1 Tax=Klebsiella pneumoniae TaxID=573 RepID=UPI00210C988E